MSYPSHSKRAGRIAVAVGFAFAAVPGAAQAAPVNLATAGPFVVLGGSTVTNTGPSVLNGDLGVAPGTSLVGFGLPAVVNGATHANDAVASQAQADLTTAYDVAAGQPVAPADDLTGTDLGNRSLTAGAYRYATSAQLTGQLTLDAQGDPDAQFVFEIGSTLTTASASSIVLVNGASPCNVFWQVGSSATLGTGTAFQGTLMALSSISLNNGATVQGRMLARNGAVTLDDNVLDGSACAPSTAVPPVTPPPVTPPVTTPPVTTPPVTTPPVTTPPVTTPPVTTPPVTTPPVTTPPTPTSPDVTPVTPAAPDATPGTPAAPDATPETSAAPDATPATASVAATPDSPASSPAQPSPGVSPQVPPASRSTVPTRRGTAILLRTPRAPGSPRVGCTAGFSATVRGHEIKRVVFRLDGRQIASRSGSPFQVSVRAAAGRHNVTALVTFKDATRAKTMKLGYRACAAAVLQPRRGPSQFTG